MFARRDRLKTAVLRGLLRIYGFGRGRHDVIGDDTGVEDAVEHLLAADLIIRTPFTSLRKLSYSPKTALRLSLFLFFARNASAA